VNPHLKQRHEGPSGSAERLPWQGNEASEEPLEASEGLGDAFVVGRRARWVPPFALSSEGDEDAERVFRGKMPATVFLIFFKKLAEIPENAF
jgi:hypothetical protein